MNSDFIYLDFLPNSPELKKAHQQLGYGRYRSRSIPVLIPIPHDHDTVFSVEKLEKYELRTNIVALQNWLQQLIERGRNVEQAKSFNTRLTSHGVNYIHHIQQTEIKEHQSQSSSHDSTLQKLGMFLGFKKEIVNKQNTIEKEHSALLKDFFKLVLKQAAFFLWNKENQQYIDTAEMHEEIDHPAPMVGNNTNCYTFQGELLTKMVTVLY